MAVYRIHKNQNYTVMSNTPMRDRRLTLKAKGLLCLMLSLPPDWRYSIAGFTAICKEGRHSISNAFRELEECGYVFIEKRYPEKGSGRIEYVYHVFEEPVANFSVSAGKTSTQFSALENQHLENPPQLNKEEETCAVDLQSQADFQVDSSSTYHFHVSSDFAPPTIDEVREFCTNPGLEHVDPDAFYAHYAAQGWVMGNSIPMNDWRWAIKKWAANNRMRDQVERAKPDKFSDLNDGWQEL
jgi:hypothetical protein